MQYDDHSFTCPHCGEPLSENATFCPACGSDSDTGWSEFADYPGLDLPDEAEEEFEQQAAAAPFSTWQLIVLLTAGVLVVLILLAALSP